MVASCWAMGRSSVEATNASLIRAVRARRAALAFGLEGFMAFLPAWLAGFVVFLATGAGFFVVGPVFFAMEEAEPLGAVAEPPADCPATGSTIIGKESRPDRKSTRLNSSHRC